MNCKPGDLAIVIKSKAGNEGKVIRCIKFVGSAPRMGGDDYWLTDGQFRSNIGYVNNFYRDAWLRPVSGIPDTEDTDIEQPIKEVA